MMDEKYLYFLMITNNKIEEKRMDLFLKSIKKMGTLKYLILNGIYFENSEIKLFDFLKNDNSLESLTINETKLSKESIEELAESLKFNNSLKILNLGYCNLGNENLKSLCQFFPFNNSIFRIDLCMNALTLNGIKEIYKSLKNNKSINSLNLGYNSSDIIMGEK